MRLRVRENFRSLAEKGLEHPGLSAGAEFYVFAVTHDCYRLVDRHGAPILYPKELFEVLDAAIPSGWEFCEYEEGAYYLEPASTGQPGFYEDWHGSDGDRVAQANARQTFS